MQELVRHVREMRNPKGVIDIILQEDNWSGVEFQTKFMDQVLKDKKICEYPPSKGYLLQLIGDYVRRLEEKNVELCEELINCYLQLQSEAKNDKFCYKSFQSNTGFEKGLDDAITVRIQKTFNLVGMTTWEAGFFLSEYILSHKDLFSNKVILELGSGIGFTSTVLAKCCDIKKLFITDYSESLLDNINHNLEINGVKQLHGVEVQLLDWTEATSESITVYKDVDTIIGADLLYDLDTIVALVDILNLLLKQNPNVNILLASTLRNENTWKFFLDRLENNNMKLCVIPTPNMKQEYFYPKDAVMFHKIEKAIKQVN